jgi:MarR family transcriptional regulator, 2-MHQ and catechol-resistance regulon repressor
MIKSKNIAVDTYVSLVSVADRKFEEVSSGLLLAGLTATQFSVLKVLRLHGPLTQREIAGRILKSEGNLTYVMDRLESLEYVLREKGKKDRRQNVVKLTELGTSFFDNEYPNHRERIEGVMNKLSEAELLQLDALLKKLGENISSTCN